MSDIAIRVKNLTKKYQLYDNPKDRMKEALHPFRKKYHKDFYALNDISFEIEKGETIGIIGKNGAGKSTLLKIITGVLSPTSGSVEVHGKISSLLELGAGFNPEMTGIENIYLNGMIMGFSHTEIDDKLETILDFADIGDFVYQPVKMYSSGMFARLAFAVAINVEPDILIVDEALSVGDARFQRKCFAKFKELQEKNITIIFVSHDLESIKTFTTRAIYLREHKIRHFGNSETSVNFYLNELFPNVSDVNEILVKSEENFNTNDSLEYIVPLSNKIQFFGIGFAEFEKITIKGMNRNIFQGQEKVSFIIYIKWIYEEVLKVCKKENLEENIIIGMYIEDIKGNKIFAFNTYLSDCFIDITKNNSTISFNIDMPVLAPGEYFIVPSIALGTHRVHTQLKWCDYYGTILSTPKNSFDFLGLVEFRYQCNKES